MEERKTTLQAIRGMSDTLPQDTPYWQHVENTLRSIASAYGYQEIRFPVLEVTNLFSRTIGEVTDIVEKEMYTFDDRGGESLTLRPEGTASCVRAGIQHGLLYNQIQRLWYMGPMFRYERPQKGRLRQFHQFGVEAFGLFGPDIDAEILLMCAHFWQALGVKDKVTLEINTLGSDESRAIYRCELVEYFKQHKGELDEDSKRRLVTNPLRILDSKNPAMREIVNQAPKLLGYLDAESQKHFDRLCHLLDKVQVEYTINPRLVRGLDYYCHTVFEWVTNELGAQGAICAGGHYDKLVAQLGGKATPALGFAVGLERLVELTGRTQARMESSPNIYMVTLNDYAFEYSLVLAEKIRATVPQIKVICNCGGGSLSAQLKRADKSGASLAIIVGDEEVEAERVMIKWLRHTEQQQELIDNVSLLNFIKQHLAKIL